MSRRLHRFENWPSRLEAAVDAARQRKFAWGRADCVTFAADCVEAMTGINLIAPYRGRYANKSEAVSLLRSLGGDVEDATRRVLGAPLATPLLAQRGDVVLVDTIQGPALGVCLGSKSGYRGPLSVVFLPTADIRLAWGV